MRLGAWLLFLSILLLIGLSAAVLAADYAVEIIPPPAKTAQPGEFVTQVFTVINQGTKGDTYDLEAAVPQGWALLGLPGEISLAAGESARVFISVLIPTTAAAGAYELTLRATSQVDPTVSASASCTIEVVALVGVQVIPPAGQEAQPGTAVTYIFTIKNTGNLAGIFELTASSSRGYPVEVEPQLLALLYGEQGQAQVSLAIPTEATPGLDRLTLRATSTEYPQIFAENSVLTRILPPGPEAAGGSLFLSLPSKVEVRTTSRDPLSVGDLETILRSSGTIPRLFTLDLRVKDPLEAGAASFDFSLRPDPPGPFALSLSKSAESIGLDLRGGLLGGGFSLSFLDMLQTEAYKVSSSLLLASGGFMVSGTAEMSSLVGAVDYAEQIDLSWRAGALLLKTRLFRIGPDFYGGGKDTEGLLAAMSFSTTWLALLSSYDYSRNNVAHKPLPVVTVSEETTRLVGALHLSGLAFPFSYSINRCHSNDSPATTDREQTETTLGFSGSLPPLSLAFSTRTETIIDQGAIDGVPTDDRFDITGLSLNLLVRQGGLFGRFGAEQEIIRSGDGSVKDQSFTTVFGLGFGGRALNGSLSLSLEEERIGLSLGASVKIGEDTDFSIASSLAINTCTGEQSFTASLGVASRFEMPTPIKVKGQLEGHLFIDSNANGRYDLGEEGIPGVIIVADGTEVSSGADGLFRFPPFWPGWFKLQIKELPAGLVPTIELPLWIKLEAGEIKEVHLPLRRVAAIEGLVFEDANRNGVHDAGERGLPGVRVSLSSASDVQTTLTGPQGRFSFVGLVPGEYRVRLEALTLPERYQPTTPVELQLTLGPGEQRWVEFGAAEKKRELVITYSPIAVFTFSPEAPHAGERVTFDGSASYDPDGYIVRYEWDFDGDGTVDAEGKTVEHLFTQPGSYQVQLAVTDNDGFKSTATEQVQILP